MSKMARYNNSNPTAIQLFREQKSRVALVGIGIFEVNGSPHWSLILHPGPTYNSPNTRCIVLRIYDSVPGEFAWKRDHVYLDLRAQPNLLGILHIHDIIMNQDIWLTRVVCDILDMPVGRKDVDPAKMVVWGPTGWAIRALKYLSEDRMAGFELPWRCSNIYMNTRPRIEALRDVKKTVRAPIRVIPIKP